MTTVHSWKQPRKLLVQLLRLHKRWAAVGYITDDQKDLLVRAFHYPEERIYRALSVRLDRFFPDPLETGAAVISLGAAKRDYPLLIEALAGLPRCQTVIYASSKYGTLYCGKTGAALPGWVQFAGRMADDEVPGCYRSSRFVVLPLQADAHSGAGVTVALEAAASGKAVIATRTRGTPFFIKDGETGILVPPGDAAALREAIAHLWENPDLAARMGQAGRCYMEEKFSFHKNILHIQQVMQAVAAIIR
jgi:glycosyltransferase involved in cell wall biosynthesis